MRAKGGADTGILSIDIETFPRVGFFWDEHKPFNIIKQIQDTTLACFCAKWLDGESITLALPDFPGYRKGSRDDRKLCKALWKLLDAAEIVVAHNGDYFDLRKIRARMIYHKMLPFSPVRTIDTYKQARAIGGFDKNRLDYLGQFLGCGRKIETGGFALWEQCLAGDEKAWKRMKRYNTQDVKLLEDVYHELLPWMRHPASLSRRFECPRCRSVSLEARGFARNKTCVYQRYQCNDCGGWCREPKAEKPALKPYIAI